MPQLTILIIASLLVVGCSGGSESLDDLTASMDVSPTTIEKKVGQDLEITVTTTSNHKTKFELTIDHNPTGIITGGKISNLSGVGSLEADGMKYSYVTESRNETARTKVTFTCGKKGETTLTFNSKATAQLDTVKEANLGPKTVKVKCTGDPLEEFATFMSKLGVPQTTINWAVARVQNKLKHSSNSVAAVKALPDILKMIAISIAMNQVLVTAAFGNTTFPCGQGADGYTICHPNKTPFPAGDVIVVAHEMDKEIELKDTKYTYQYGFVFDSDGDTTNNYQPAAAYPNDFFKDSDLWFEANYTPSGGWTMKVTDAKGGATNPITSAARIVMLKKTAVLVVPASELKVKKPSYRVEVFRHTGDYGINPPHDWSGDVEPEVAKGLQSW